MRLAQPFDWNVRFNSSGSYTVSTQSKNGIGRTALSAM